MASIKFHGANAHPTFLVAVLAGGERSAKQREGFVRLRNFDGTLNESSSVLRWDLL